MTRRSRSLVGVVALGACAGPAPNPAAPDASALDAPSEAGERRWSMPRLVDGVSSPSTEDDPSFTADHLTIVFTSTRNGTGDDIFLGTRPDPEGSFSLLPLDALLSPAEESSPELSADGTTLLFASDRSGDFDIYMATRPPNGTFSAPTRVDSLSTVGANETDVALSPDGLTAILRRDGTFMRARREDPSAAFDPPIAIAGVAFGTNPSAPSLDAAGDLYFHAGTQRDLFVARAQGASFADPTPIPELATSARESGPCISADETYLMFARGGQIMETTRP
jgi:Tol biopolymer transport system component